MKNYFKKALAIILAGAMMLLVCACGEDPDTSTTKEKKKTSTGTNSSSAQAVVEGFWLSLADGDVEGAFANFTIIDEDFYDDYLAEDGYDYEEYCDAIGEEFSEEDFEVEFNDLEEEKMSSSEIEDLEDNLEDYDISGIKKAYTITADFTVISADDDEEDMAYTYTVIEYHGEYKIVPDFLFE